MGITTEEAIRIAKNAELKKSLCRMVVKGQKQYLASPAGEIFKMQCTTEVKQDINASWGG